jgi:hypothetical protein
MRNMAVLANEASALQRRALAPIDNVCCDAAFTKESALFIVLSQL